MPVFYNLGLTGGIALPTLSSVHIFFYPSLPHFSIVPEMTYDSDAAIFLGGIRFSPAGRGLRIPIIFSPSAKHSAGQSGTQRNPHALYGTLGCANSGRL